MGGGQRHQRARGNKEVHGHVHHRNEDMKAETLGGCF